MAWSFVGSGPFHRKRAPLPHCPLCSRADERTDIPDGWFPRQLREETLSHRNFDRLACNGTSVDDSTQYSRRIRAGFAPSFTTAGSGRYGSFTLMRTGRSGTSHWIFMRIQGQRADWLGRYLDTSRRAKRAGAVRWDRNGKECCLQGHDGHIHSTEGGWATGAD